MSEIKYKCEDCANQATPICENCTRIESPSGRERKPKFYVALSKEAPADFFDRTAPFYLMQKMFAYIHELKPIPVALILEYNKCAERLEINRADRDD